MLGNVLLKFSKHWKPARRVGLLDDPAACCFSNGWNNWLNERGEVLKIGAAGSKGWKNKSSIGNDPESEAIDNFAKA